MINSKFRKGLVFGIIVLFVGAGVIPSTIGIIEKKTTITNFGSRGYIQNLIDNASDGETFYNVNITREKIIEIAEAYLTHEWYPTVDNIYHGYCPHCGKWVNTPDSNFYGTGWRVGQMNIGVPYQWGGFSSLSGLNLSNEEDFDEQYTGTGEYVGIIHYAGDIYCVGSECSNACGVDCSGFVSRCWNLPFKKSTSTLPGISNIIKYEYLKPGDILDKPGSHVILFKEFVNEEKTLIRTIEANFPKVFENIYFAEVSQDGYSVTLDNGTTYQIYSYKEIPNSKPDAPTIDGPVNCKSGIQYDFVFNSIDSDGDDVRFIISWDDGDNETTIFVSSGTDLTASHSWATQGTYIISVKAEDVYGAESNWSEPFTVVVENQPPNKPGKPSGKIKGKINVEYTYSTITNDSDEDQIYYNWSWGDGTYSGWLGPFNSNITVNAKHTWTTKGTYQIKVKAKDIFDAESDWSDSLSVTMPRTIGFRSFLLEMLEQYPNMFPILRHILVL